VIRAWRISLYSFSVRFNRIAMLYSGEPVDSAFSVLMMPTKDIEPTSVQDVAERLAITRDAMGWSQAELCRRSGISKQSWNNAETADERISVDNAIKLCRATHVTLDWVYRGTRALLPANVLAMVNAPAKRQMRRRA
jgi:DNA-binding XRE family transcriptional regulator